MFDGREGFFESGEEERGVAAGNDDCCGGLFEERGGVMNERAGCAGEADADADGHGIGGRGAAAGCLFGKVGNAGELGGALLERSELQGGAGGDGAADEGAAGVNDFEREGGAGVERAGRERVEFTQGERVGEAVGAGFDGGLYFSGHDAAEGGVIESMHGQGAGPGVERGAQQVRGIRDDTGDNNGADVSRGLLEDFGKGRGDFGSGCGGSEAQHFGAVCPGPFGVLIADVDEKKHGTYGTNRTYY